MGGRGREKGKLSHRRWGKREITDLSLSLVLATVAWRFESQLRNYFFRSHCCYYVGNAGRRERRSKLLLLSVRLSVAAFVRALSYQDFGNWLKWLLLTPSRAFYWPRMTCVVCCLLSRERVARRMFLLSESQVGSFPFFSFFFCRRCHL